MSFLKESSATMRLAAPLISGLISQMLLGVADTIMVGRLGVSELAGLTLCNNIFWIAFVFGIGFVTSVAVLSSHAYGAESQQEAKSSVQHGLYLSIIVSIVLTILLYPFTYHLDILHQPPNATEHAAPFLRVLTLSLLPGLAATALKNHADALNRPWMPFWIFLGAIVLNVFLNYLFIYGNWGMPAYGMIAAAWATFVSRIAMLIAMLVWLRKDKMMKQWTPKWFSFFRKSELLEQYKIGAPSGIQMLSECSAFCIAGIIIGKFGESSMAAHQIAATCGGVFFMLPCGLSHALAVRVGNAYGAKEFSAIKDIAHNGWTLALSIAAVNAAILFLLEKEIAAAFHYDETVRAIAASLLSIVAVFQIVDAMQVSSIGILRGMKETTITAWIGFISYWIIGIPLGYFLGDFYHMQTQGIWWGLALGLACAAIILTSICVRKMLVLTHAL